MAGGEHTLRLDVTLSDQALRHLKARAEKLGVTLSVMASEVLELQLFDYADYDWGADPNGDPRIASVHEVADEPTHPADEVLAEFRAELETRLAARR